MDANLKAKWVEALRSGEFKQARSVLHDAKEDAYCCLGVLCRVAGAEWTSFNKEVEGEEGLYIKRFDYVPVKAGQLLGNTDDEELEISACKEFGIPDQSILIGMNDGGGVDSADGPKTFAEIADYIEANL